MSHVNLLPFRSEEQRPRNPIADEPADRRTRQRRRTDNAQDRRWLPSAQFCYETAETAGSGERLERGRNRTQKTAPRAVSGGSWVALDEWATAIDNQSDRVEVVERQSACGVDVRDQDG